MDQDNTHTKDNISVPTSEITKKTNEVDTLGKILSPADNFHSIDTPNVNAYNS